LLAWCAGCGDNPTPSKVARKRVGLVISPRGLGDHGFNDQAYMAMKSAENNCPIDTVLIEPVTMQDQESSLRFFGQQRLDAVIAMGFAFEASTRAVASEYPQLPFFIIDSTVDEGNLEGISFREDEGSFLCGALAALVTRTGKIGFVGGMDNPIIQRFLDGYRRGALHIATATEVLQAFAADDYSGFTNPDHGKEKALGLYAQGCDVIYHAAGGSGLGVISAAVETQKFCIGADMDQDALAPGRVLTSMRKRVDRVIASITTALTQTPTPVAVQRSYGLADGGLSLTRFQFSHDVVTPAIQERLRGLHAEIIGGRLATR